MTEATERLHLTPDRMRTIATAAATAGALALLAALALPARASPSLVPAQSEIAFTSTQMGVPVDGRFRRFDAQVDFDPKKPAAAKIALAIDLASVSIGAADTEAELAKPEWFGTKSFPRATFQASVVKPTGSGRFDVGGTLTIKSISRDVVVPVTITQAAGLTTASGVFSIKRLDFRIGEGEWKDTSMVADPVQVKFKLVLSGVAPI